MRTIALLIAAAAGLTASRASAAPPDCANLPDEPAAGALPKLYIENGDTQEAMIKAMGALLIKSSDPVRVLYRNRPTCNLRIDLYTDATMHAVTDGTTPRPVKYIPVDGSAPVECAVPATDTGAVPIQLGIGATYLSDCTDVIASPDASVAQFAGPILPYGFITHNQSTQSGITYEEAHLAWGYTEGFGNASPWLIQNLRFKRSNTASTTLTMASAIDLKATDLKAAPALSPETSQQLITVVAAATNPEASIGVLGMDLRDANRSVIKMLPFKAKNQRYGYWPDKTNDSFEKQNVRDGHYLPWAPTPYIAKTDASGSIADPLAKRFYDLVLGNRVDADVNGLRVITKAGLVPQCAMKVTRPSDGADLTSYSDANPCGCFFEANVPQGATSCTTCTDDSSCGGGKCRFGYCEAN